MKTATSASSIDELKARLATSGSLSPSHSSPDFATTAAAKVSSGIPNPFQATPSNISHSMHKMPFGTARPTPTVPNMASPAGNAGINSSSSFLAPAAAAATGTSVNRTVSFASAAQIVNGFLQRDQLKLDLGELLQGKDSFPVMSEEWC